MKKRTRRGKGLFSMRLITGALWGCGAALAGLLLLSLVLYRGMGNENWVAIGNGVLKVLCPCVAGWFAVKAGEDKPGIKGAIAGGLFDCCMVLLLCVFLGEPLISWALCGDFLMSVASGAAGAMIKGLLPGAQKMQKR